MLSKLFFVALTSLSVLSRTAAANLPNSDEVDKIIRRTIESTDFREIHKERTLSYLRELEVSQTCIDETNALAADEDIAAFLEDTNNVDTSGCDVSGNERDVKIECDYEILIPGFQSVCETAGGQYFTLTIEVSGKSDGVKMTIIFKNMGSCAGASCDTDEIIEEAKAASEALKDYYEALGFTVKISRSDYKSTYVALGAAASAAFAFFFV